MNSSSNSASSLKSFNVIDKLGQGSFASVYKVQRIDDNKLYAMKKVSILSIQVKIGQMKEKERDNALNQVRVLASISHPNIVNYKQAFFDDPTQSLCIVMELADAGDVQKKINEHIKNHTYFTEFEIWQALIQMSKGLKALHEINILHRDLKCANIFCTKEQKYKLGDLNVSKVAKKGMARTQTGTPYYTSPEVWKDRPYDSKCDIWSLGCVIYQMASLSPPFRANTLKQLYTKIQRGIYNRIPSFYSQDLTEIINLCLRVNPSSRPSAIQILDHPKIKKNTPNTQKYNSQENFSKKANLLNTILCPRNLRSLKIALPGAKYEEQPEKIVVRPSSVDGRREESHSRRVLSARGNNAQRPNDIPRVINSPKMGELPSRDIRYALQRRPSSERNILPSINRKQANSQVRERQNSRAGSRNNSRIVRNNSVDSIRKRNDSIRSIQNNPSRRRDDRSQERVQAGRAFVEDISNRCRNIKERVELMMANQRGERIQKVSNSYEKRYNLPINNNSKEKRQNSNSGRLSRNNSIEIKPNANNIPIQKQMVVRRNSEKSLERNRSNERLQRPVTRKGYDPPRILPYRR